MSDAPTSKSLLAKARNCSDQAAWRRLTELYEPLIERWARPHVAQRADAEDVVQEVMTTLVRELPRFDMCLAMRSPRSRKTLVRLACLAGVLGFSVPGCSFGGGDATLSPEAQAKAKENFKKRFDTSGARKTVRKPSR